VSGNEKKQYIMSRKTKKLPVRHQQIFSVLAILSTSFAKLPVYQSKAFNQTENKVSTIPFSNHFDEKRNVRYGIAHNDTNFYIQAIFKDRDSFMKIMRGGLIVYFAPEGKKKKNYKLSIEKSDQHKMGISNQLSLQEGGQIQSIPESLALLFNKGCWNKNGTEFVFYRNILKDPISVDLTPYNETELVLDIKMPLSEIPFIEGLNLFSVGIETGSISSGRMTRSNPGAGMRTSGGIGGRGGGRGGAGGGIRGEGGSGSRASGGGASSGMEPIRIWFQVQF